MIRFDVLGPTRVIGDDGAEVVVAGNLQRRLLVGLVMQREAVVSADVLSEIVWGPAHAPVDSGALQSLVFRLKKRVPGLDLEHRGHGYVLHCGHDSVDVAEFERLVWEASAQRDRPEEAIGMLDRALGLWRGLPYSDLVDFDAARIEIERISEVRHRACEDRFELLVDQGRTAEVLADLEAFVATNPLREHPRRVLMDALAATGRRADALRAYDIYRRLLAEELGVSPSPTLRQRHDELLAEDDTTVPEAQHRVRLSPATPLRRPTSSLIGRDDAIGDLIRRVETRRLTTLIGPGGVGKTRLALEAAHRLAATFGDGVVFCDLTRAAADGKLASGGQATVVGVVAAALGVEGRADRNDLDRVCDVVRHDRILLILDNCEHVIDDAAVLVDHVLTMTESVAIIATSRERLAVDGEELVPVSPLPHSVSEGSSPSMQLLTDRARLITTFEPDDHELELLDELCQRLDGLPLAIELAAARLQTMSVVDVVAGLENSLSVLRGGRRNVERHRSVDAALRWSYDLLDDAQRRALRAAAMFSATFRSADVAAVMDLDPSTAGELMADLVGQSMAHRDGSNLYLLDIVRRFAREQSPAGEIPGFLGRFSAQMLVVGQQLSNDLRTSLDDTPIKEFTRRTSDFRLAWSTALAAGDAAVALGLAVGVRELSLNCQSAEAMGWGAEAAALGDQLDHPLTADGYAVAAMAAWKRSDLNSMRELLDRAERAVARLDLGDRYLVVGTLGVEDLAHGRLDSAIDRAARATACDDALADPLRQADAWGTQAICMSYAHDPAAVSVAQRLVDEHGHANGAVTRAWCWYALGECLIDIDPAASRHHLDHAVLEARRSGASFVEGVAGASLASIDARTGNASGAIATYRRLLPLWQRAGVRSPFWTAMRSVAGLLAEVGEHESAARLLGAVMAPGSGHEVFGDDADRLAALQVELESVIGAERFAELFAAGEHFDEAAAAREATAAFDRIN